MNLTESVSKGRVKHAKGESAKKSKDAVTKHEITNVMLV